MSLRLSRPHAPPTPPEPPEPPPPPPALETTLRVSGGTVSLAVREAYGGDAELAVSGEADDQGLRSTLTRAELRTLRASIDAALTFLERGRQ